MATKRPLCNYSGNITEKSDSDSIVGLVIGTDVQAHDGDLAAIAALAGTSGYLKKTAANTWALDTTGVVERQYVWVISAPAVGGVLGPRLKSAKTCVRLDSHVAAATSVTFNIEERTAAGTAGTNVVTSDQVASTTGASTGSFSNADLAADNWLYVDISAVSGTPGQLCIILTVTNT